MLSTLSVSNLAVVEKAEADFAPGLNVLTGETGAGKSVMMGALDLILGGRADPDAVREGAKEARVEAVFAVADGSRAAALLDEAGLPACEDGLLVVRRVVAADGKGKVWANDASTTVAFLRRLGRELVDIHGPRANQDLLEEGFQRGTLDAYGATGAARAKYAAAWEEYARLTAEKAALDRADAGTVADEIELLRYQVNELDEADVTEEDETLADRHAAAAHAGEIVEGANAVTDALGGDRSALTMLADATVRLRALARRLPEAEAWASEAEELSARVEELSRSVADAASRVDSGEEDLDALDARLTLLNRLKRKYPLADAAFAGGDIARLREVHARKRARLAELEGRGERLAALAGEIASATAALASAGRVLSAARKKAAARFGAAVTDGLRALGFLQARFSVALSAAEPAPHGCDRVAYLFEPNPGEPARELAAIASSGEIARVMLALKAVVAEHDSVGTLVFDEIDANIGGEVGKAVGERLRAVAAHRQVIAITHLPQSAAWGERHLVMSKGVSGGRTRSAITCVEGEARVKELARMLGGEKLTSVVTRHAEELLASTGALDGQRRAGKRN